MALLHGDNALRDEPSANRNRAEGFRNPDNVTKFRLESMVAAGRRARKVEDQPAGPI